MLAQSKYLQNHQSSPQSPRFLVADAEAQQRRIAAQLLGQLGFGPVLDVGDGPSALRRLADADIVIVDLGLSGMDGLGLLRAIADLGAPVRVIVTGDQPASVMFSVETLAHAYGVDLLGTISKPLTPAKLKVLLDRADDAAASRPAPQPQPVLNGADVAAGLRQRQFEPFFQPRIDLATGTVKGLEAFARWRHPEHGVLGPAAFIDALQAGGRVGFLDWAMLDASVAHCRALHDAGLPLSISLNLDPATLAHPDFLAQVQACMARHGVLPDYLTFEMTESSILDFDAAFIERLVRLRMLGCGLAIDDYGTGRSNLQLLARVPFSELKIDRAFVDGASKNRPLGTVLRSCLGLAKSLDRMSTAVGVETREDWDFLQGLGCTYAQGYYIGNPMEAGAIPGWIEDWRQFF